LHERLQKEGVKTHKEKVEELNKYLSNLSEHHDMYVPSFPGVWFEMEMEMLTRCRLQAENWTWIMRSLWRKYGRSKPVGGVARCFVVLEWHTTEYERKRIWATKSDTQIQWRLYR
jgi:hypothetical protein